MPGPDLRGDFCLYFPLVLLGVNSIHLGLLGRFGEIHIYIFFHCCCCSISKRTTAHVGAGRAEQGRELRQTWQPQLKPQPSALSPLPDEGGHCAGAGCEEAWARLEGQDESTATSLDKGTAG